MSEDQNSLLLAISRDVSQMKSDLAVNTVKTAAIEDHLKTLNSKVATQEKINADQVKTNRDFIEQNKITASFITDQQNLKRRKSDSWRNFLEKALWAIIPPLSVAIWKAIEWLANNGAFN